MKYFCLWIDDERKTPSIALKPNIPFDKNATTTNEAIKIINKKYKEGVRNFFLDIDNDTEDALTNIHGGEFYNVLTTIEQLIHLGRMKDVNFSIRIHTGNCVARQRMRSLIEKNNKYFCEVR